MTLSPEQHAVLPASVSTPAVCLLAIAGAAAWVAVHRIRPPASRSLRTCLIASRVGIGFLALLAVMQVAMRFILLATNWPLWPIALAGAGAVETLLGLYALERRTVSRRAGTALAAIRIALILLVIAILTQPRIAGEFREDLQRTIVVLVDDSASMHVPDTKMTEAEKLRMAELFGVEPARRFHRLELVAEFLRDTRPKVDRLHDMLSLLKELPPDRRKKRLEEKREDLHEEFTELAKALDNQIKTFAKATDGRLSLPVAVKTKLQHVKAELRTQVHDRVAEAASFTQDKKKVRKKLPERYEQMTAGLRRAAIALGALAPEAETLGEKVDELFYKSLPKEKQKQIDAVTRLTRARLARAVLQHRRPRDDRGGDPNDSLMKQLQDQYAIKLYTFAAGPVETEMKWLGEPNDSLPEAPPEPATRPAASQPTTFPADQQVTDLAAALAKVMTDITAERLAGVLLLTDGRHNGAARLEAAARRMGALDVPICSIAVGSRKPPTDAAVLELDAPETVYAKDTVYVNAKLKLDGMAGKTVKIALYEKLERVDRREIRVPADTFRTHVQLSHMPKKAGLCTYRVAIEPVDREVLATNNQRSLSVSVIADRIQVLLVDGRPRWEFRYLKNLFANRDRTVKLQYVVFEPDRVAGVQPRGKIVAKAGQPPKKIEATALPETLAEWMKFDVILLGDLPPTSLRRQDLAALRRFVVDRGGTLIIIAGPQHMPQAFVGTQLEDLLPVRLRPDLSRAGTDTKQGFRIALTPAGGQHVIMRQAVEPGENRRIWTSLPKLYWRLPIAEAKPGAEVLAFAMPDKTPDLLQPSPDKKKLRVGEKLLELRRKFMRDNALISLQRNGLGQVMFLSFDRTWRLRYRKGDLYHHKFWGQVLRWATANKLPAGTDLVKIGTDRVRYTPESRIRVRAKIVRPDLSPVVSKNVTASVYEGRKLLLKKKLQHQKDSAGLYEADLGGLPGGSYLVKIDAPQIKELLAGSGVKEVVTGFSVEQIVPAEQTELVADRGLLRRLASLTGGAVAEPPRAQRLLGLFGEPILTRRELRQRVLWDNWPYLTLILILVTAEWLLRKKVGLA